MRELAKIKAGMLRMKNKFTSLVTKPGFPPSHSPEARMGFATGDEVTGEEIAVTPKRTTFAGVKAGDGKE